MNNPIDPAELLKNWMHEYEAKIRELQCVSAYLKLRIDGLETPSVLDRPRTPSGESSPPSPFLKVDEVAKMLSITPMGIRTRLKKRLFPPGVVVKVGRRSIRFDRERLLDWIRSCNTKDQAGTRTRR